MSSPAIITHPDNITPAWLTQVLQHSGLDARVDDMHATHVGTGQVGENVRFHLTGNGVPASVIGKFASLDPQSKQTGIDLQNYIREVFFYQTLQAGVDIQTPHILFADANPQNHDFVIIMEDLAPGKPGDQLAGCSIDEAALALEQLAKLQGPRWGDRSLKPSELLSDSLAPEGAANKQIFYQALEPAFMQRYQERLVPDHVRLVNLVGERLDDSNEMYEGEGPGVLIHVDYRLDNMMFGGPNPLTVVDWQSIALGCPLMDVSYFLGTSLASNLRLKEEQQLVKHYLGVLKSYRVNLDFNEAFRYYRNYAPAGLVMAVIASTIVGETERGNDMFMAMANRSCQMCLELDWAKLTARRQ
jgi:hypothetical protein